jgi:hypothetical protein
MVKRPSVRGFPSQNHLYVHHQVPALRMATSEPFCLHWLVWVTIGYLLVPLIILIGIFTHDLVPDSPTTQPQQTSPHAGPRRLEDDQDTGDDPGDSADTPPALAKMDTTTTKSRSSRSTDSAYREAIKWQAVQLLLVWAQISCCKKLAACNPQIHDANTMLVVGFMLFDGGLVLYSLCAFLMWPISTSGERS